MCQLNNKNNDNDIDIDNRYVTKYKQSIPGFVVLQYMCCILPVGSYKSDFVLSNRPNIMTLWDRV